ASAPLAWLALAVGVLLQVLPSVLEGGASVAGGVAHGRLHLLRGGREVAVDHLAASCERAFARRQEQHRTAGQSNDQHQECGEGRAVVPRALVATAALVGFADIEPVNAAMGGQVAIDAPA